MLITKGKYIIFNYCVKKAVWIWKIVNKITLKVKNNIFYMNNKKNINLTKNAKSQYYTKYNNI